MQGTITTYRYGNAEIVVHRPALSEQERVKREATLRRALIAYGKETVRAQGGCQHDSRVHPGQL